MPRTSPATTAPAPGRARRFFKAILVVVIAPILLGAFIVVILATTTWGNERVRRFVVSQGNDRLTGELSVGTLHGNLFRGATLTDVRIVDSARRPLLTARRAEVRYALMPALSGRVVIRSLVLDTPVVVLNRAPGQRWNFQSLIKSRGRAKGATRTNLPPQINDVTIRHGRMIYRRPWRPDTSLAADKRDAAITAALGASARRRTERVPGGYQRILDYHDIDARLPVIRIGSAPTPTVVQIGALSMLAEPYRPPALQVRSLVGTLFVSKDSLWWRGARLVTPASNVSGDGTVGFRKSGFRLDLTGAPLALADLRWINPKLPARGGGPVRYRMRTHGDTAEYAISDADLRYGDASVKGAASLARVKPKGRTAELFVRGADLTVARLSTAAIHELAPSLKLPRSGVLHGHIAVNGQPSALQLDADVRFDDAASGRSHVLARGGLGFGGGIRAHDLILQLRPLQLASLGGTGLRLPVGGVLTGDATVSGTQKEGWTVSGDLVHQERGERSRVTGTGRYAVRGKRVVADATLQPLSLITVGRFVPTARLRGDVTGRVHAEGTTRDLRIAGTLRSPAGGSVEGRGTVALQGSRTRYDISVALDALNANAFSRRAPGTRLTGTLSARGTGTTLATANAAVSVDLSRSRYDTFTVDRLRARAVAAGGLLRLDTLYVIERGARASAGGTFGITSARRGSLRFALDVDSLSALRQWIGGSDTGFVAAASGRQRALLVAARADSARRAKAMRIEQLALRLPEGVTLVRDTLASVKRDSLAGSLHATGTLVGNVKELGVDATVSGSGLVMRGITARRLNASIVSSNVRNRTVPLSFRIDADTVQASGYGFEHVEGSGRWVHNRIMADVRVRQNSRVSYAILGSYGRPSSGTHVIQLDSLRATFDTLVWRLAHRAGVQLSGELIDVDSVELRSSAGGRLFANGTVPKAGLIRLDVAAENVHLATLFDALQRDAAADGVIGASGTITGTRIAPAMVGRVTLRDATYRGTRAPDADVDLRYLARRLGLEATARDSTGRRVLAGSASLPLDFAFSGVSGSRKLEGALHADVTMDSLPLGALPIASRRIADVAGRVAGNARVRGSWRAPVYSGNAALRDGAATLVSTGMRVDNALADLRLAGDTLVLDSLVARAGGPLRASGTVELTDRAHPFVRLNASGTNLRVFDALRGVVDANGEIVAIGPLHALRVTGGGTMLGGYLALKQFRKDLLRVKAPGDLAFFAVLDTTAAANDSVRVKVARDRPRRVAMIADLALVIDRGNFYRNRPDANTEFYTGEREVVRAHIDQRSDDQWAVGFVRIGDAGVTLFRTLAFVNARGTLTFGPHTDAPGVVQQVGERMVWEAGRGLFPVQLLTGGTSKAPAIGLESGSLFPIRGRELNSYLTMGRLSMSLLQQSGSSLSGSETWSGQLSGETGALARRQQGATALGVVLHDIGTGATKEFGLDAFSVSPADVPTELVFGKTGGVRGALIEGGRYLTPYRYVAGQLRFTTGIPGFRVAQRYGTAYRLDVGIEPRFLFRAQSELGITHPTVRTGAFGAFLTRMWSW